MQTIYFSSARNRSFDRLDKARKGSWITLVAPSQQEIEQFATQYKLDPDLLNDAIDLYEAPRIEVDDGNVYIFTRYCHPEGADIATEPLLIVHTSDYLITISRLEPPAIHRLVASSNEIITTQKTKTLMLILAQVNQSYRLHLNKVSKQILRFRAELRKSDISNREFISILELEEDLNEFLAALQPQAAMMTALTNGKSLRLYEEDKDIVEDLQLDILELIEFTKSRQRTLSNIRQVHDAIATNNLNRTFKRLTSIAIFLSVVTVVAGLWGMNVKVPFGESSYGFWIVNAIAISLMTGFVLFFSRKNWL